MNNVGKRKQKVYVAHVDMSLKGKFRGSLTGGIRKSTFPISTCTNGVLEDNLQYNIKAINMPTIEAKKTHTYHTILANAACYNLQLPVMDTKL